jgi:hypothetical protein
VRLCHILALAHIVGLTSPLRHLCDTVSYDEVPSGRFWESATIGENP